MSETDPGFALTPAQIACAQTYASGDFAHVIEAAERGEKEFDREVAGCGDALFGFLMRELDQREDCDGIETALERLEMAIEDVRSVKDAVDELLVPSAAMSR